MKKTMRRMISIILVITLCMPLFGETVGNTVYATSETKETHIWLSDGSEWIFNAECKDDKLSALSDGSYQIETSVTDNSSPANAFSMMRKRAYPASTVHNLSVDYRNEGTSFGFTTTGSLPTGSQNGEGVVKFNRTEEGNTTALYLHINGTPTKVASFTDTTRPTLAEITIVKAANGSYYLSFNGNVVDGSKYATDVQEAVKLENYFTKEYLERDGMLYFFVEADGFNYENKVRYFVSSTYGYPYTESSLASTSDRNTPSTWKICKADTLSYGNVEPKTYEFVAGTDGKVQALEFPVTALGDSKAAIFTTQFTYSSNNIPYEEHDLHYIDFSSDPNFKTYDSIKIARVNAGGMPHVVFNDETAYEFENMLYDGANSKNSYYGAVHYWTFRIEDGVVKLDILLNKRSGGTVEKTFSGFKSISANKPIYMKIKAPDVSKYIDTNPDVNLKYKVTTGIEITAMEEKIKDAKTAVDSGEKKIWDYADMIDAYKFFSMKKGLSYEALQSVSELITKYTAAMNTVPTDPRGDLNENGFVDSPDSHLMRMALGYGYTYERYNINNDEEVNLMDLVALIKKYDGSLSEGNSL